MNGNLSTHEPKLASQEGLMPRIVSGVSGGSIVAGFLAIHSDAEILDHVFVPEIVERHPPHRWFPHWWQAHARGHKGLRS